MNTANIIALAIVVALFVLISRRISKPKQVIAPNDGTKLRSPHRETSAGNLLNPVDPLNPLHPMHYLEDEDIDRKPTPRSPRVNQTPDRIYDLTPEPGDRTSRSFLSSSLGISHESGSSSGSGLSGSSSSGGNSGGDGGGD